MPSGWDIKVRGGHHVAKHTQASLIELLVTSDDRHLRVEISDDGIGGADATTGSGLRGLADRIEVLHGHFAVVSPPGHGTHITAVIPVSMA